MLEYKPLYCFETAFDLPEDKYYVMNHENSATVAVSCRVFRAVTQKIEGKKK